jgi:hypothetical protein
MSVSYSAIIDILDKHANEFVDQTKKFTSNLKELQGGQVSINIAAVEDSHKQIGKIFQIKLDEITAIKLHISDVPNQDAVFPYVAQLTGCEDKFREQLNRFNDEILTYCPTAKIQYGDPCIGKKEVAQKNNLPGNPTHFRKIRGDGNCFLSSFLTRLLENLLENKCIDRFIGFISGNQMDKALKEELLTTLNELKKDPSQLENVLQNNHKVLPFINYFRQLAANEMKEHEEDYKPFFAFEEVNSDPFNIRPMGVDFSQPTMMALYRKLNFLDFPVKIFDKNIGAPEGLIIRNDKQLNNPDDKPYHFATFCRDGAHYFVLYTREDAKGSPITFDSAPSVAEKKDAPVHTTRITVHYPAGLGNALYISGNGPGMDNWRPIRLGYTDNDDWVFETSDHFEKFDYKILFNKYNWEENNKKWEQLENDQNNRTVEYENKEKIYPKFN